MDHWQVYFNTVIRCLLVSSCSLIICNAANTTSVSPQTLPTTAPIPVGVPVGTTTNHTFHAENTTGSTTQKTGSGSTETPPSKTTLASLQPKSTTEIDHFDRQHPVNFSSTRSKPFNLTIKWSISSVDIVDLNSFNIYYYRSVDEDNLKKHFVITVPPNITSKVLTRLQPGTQYSIIVEANYTSGHLPQTFTLKRKTMGYGIDNPCNCSKLGTVDHSTCDPITGQCPCRNKLTIGRDCRECTKLSFLHPVTGCHPCPPCPKPRSLGSCHTNQRGVVVCDCLGNYSGSECKYCAPNFYVSGDSCEPCKCGNNTHPEQSRECDLHTGVCINCLHNTTGKYCHKCLRNYVGDPLVAKNCTHIDDVPRPMRSSHYSPVYQFFHDHLGVIVGILVSILTLLTLIVALTIYKRWRRWKRRPLQFWTVQLKEDHERVSFSSDHPYQHVDASLLSDDVQFRIPTDTSYENDEPNHRLKTRTRAGDSANPYQSLN